MSFDRKELEQSAKRVALQQAQFQRGNLIQLRQAAVGAEQMMGTPEWDVFLSYLEAARVDATKLRNALNSDLIDPRLVNSDEVMKRRIAIFRLDERIKTLTQVIAMPSEIRKHGKVADERLRELAKLEEKEQAA